MAVPPERFRGGGGWVIGGGVLFPVVTLTLLQLYEFGLVRRLAAAPEPALVVEVTGVLWWWDVRYHAAGREPVRSAPIRSANEIVLPAGRPVEIRVDSADVIHSFWIPSLAGKIDMIPGRINRLSLTAETPGVYRGQCAEFCGAQHALMAFDVVVEPPDRFDAWLEGQRRPVAEPADPLLWQHLFWFFGHPEVYIIFLPAAGLVSTMVPALAGRPLVGHDWVVLALVGTGFFSFGLWVHHMFATGIPSLSLGFFSAASMAVAVPSGIQVFAWIATLGGGRVRWTMATRFLMGFLFIFVAGGLTGVMVAVVPFDWQVHDSYFVVAHLLARNRQGALRAGLMHAERRVTFDNTMLMGCYSAAQGAVALLVLHLFPQLAV